MFELGELQVFPHYTANNYNESNSPNKCIDGFLTSSPSRCYEQHFV